MKVTTSAEKISLLGRKQSAPQQDEWARALEAAYATPDRYRAERLVDTAVAKIENRIAGKRAAFGWSGGKDSQGLRFVAERAGVHDCVLAISQLEYPAFLAWATDNMPWGCYVEARPLDLKWLSVNPTMLFPQDAATAAKWFRLVQHEGQRAYCKKQEIEVLILGRRRADGNYIGGPTDEYVDKDGFARFSPIADWTHEDLLTVLGAYAMPLPPCYWWPRGFQVGTGSWPARQFAPPEQAWAEVMQIDASVVKLAASVRLPGAREAIRLNASLMH